MTALSLGRELKIAMAVILVASGALVWWNFYQQTQAPAPVQQAAPLPRPAVTTPPPAAAPGAAPAVAARQAEVPAIPFLVAPTLPAAAVPVAAPEPIPAPAPAPAAQVAPAAARPQPTALINPFAPIILRAAGPVAGALEIREIPAPAAIERSIVVPTAALAVPTGAAARPAEVEFGALTVQAAGTRRVVPQILTSPFAEPGFAAPAITRLVVEPTEIAPATRLPAATPAGRVAVEAAPLMRAFEGPAAGHVVAAGTDPAAPFEITRLLVQPTGATPTTFAGIAPRVGPAVTPTALATPAAPIHAPAVIGVPDPAGATQPMPAAATRLEEIISRLQLVYSGVVLGPINTAIFRSVEGGFAVPLGGRIPGTEVIVQAITAESVTLALETDRAEIDFAR